MTRPAPDTGPRNTTSTRIGALDGLRALAIVTIVLLHLLGISGVLYPGRDDALARLIWIGVGNTIDLFFVLSGFLLFVPVVRRGFLKGGALHFYARRLARIQPEYWFCLLTVFLMIVLIPVAFPPPVPSPGEVLIHVFDLQTVARFFDHEFLVGFWIDGALWIVPVLVGLYLLFPLFARLMLNRTWVALLLALLVTVAWKLLLHHAQGPLSGLSGGEATHDQLLVIGIEQSPSFAFSFAAGMGAAMLWVRSSQAGFEWVRRYIPAAFAIAVAVWLFTSNAFSEAAMQSATGFDSSSFGRTLIWENLAGTLSRAVLVLAVAFAPVWVTGLLDNRVAAWASGVSFGVFMIHLPIAFYADQLLSLPNGGTLADLLLWLLVVTPPSVLWAWSSRRLVGLPAIAWTEERLTGKTN